MGKTRGVASTLLTKKQFWIFNFELWQLSGDRKNAIHENMDYDLFYIRNMSFSLDIAILIETLIFAFRGV